MHYTCDYLHAITCFLPLILPCYDFCLDLKELEDFALSYSTHMTMKKIKPLCGRYLLSQSSSYALHLKWSLVIEDIVVSHHEVCYYNKWIILHLMKMRCEWNFCSDFLLFTCISNCILIRCCRLWASAFQWPNSRLSPGFFQNSWLMNIGSFIRAGYEHYAFPTPFGVAACAVLHSLLYSCLLGCLLRSFHLVIWLGCRS